MVPNNVTEATTVTVGISETVTLTEAADLFAALSSESRRSMLAFLSEQPTTAATLAKEFEMSIQNVLYHIQQLQDAELIKIVETHYSSKGREMAVYAPAQPAIVIELLETDSEGHKRDLEVLAKHSREAETTWPALCCKTEATHD